MKDNSKKYWKGIEELSNDPTFLKDANNEFPEFLSVKETRGNDSADSGTDRRDFLKLMGFGVAAASLAACDAPVRRVIPYVNKPEDVDPGIANWYASTYQEGGEYCSILVKTREGRPIKIEGNNLSSITKGGTSPKVQASVLSLYDITRLTTFTKAGKKIDKNLADSEIVNGLRTATSSGLGIRIISPTILSPSTKSLIADFKSKYPTTQHIVFDPISVSGLIKANKASFGKAVVPSYDFSKASVIVSFGADFLGTWLSPIEFARQYGANKKLGASRKTMVRHYQVETNLSLTGSNADFRLPIRPSQEGIYIAELYNRISPSKIATAAVKNEMLDKMAADLLASKGKSIVVSGSNDVSVQILVNQINTVLGNYGTTIDLSNPSLVKQGDEQNLYNFIQEAKAGRIGAVIFYKSNPVYNSPWGAELEAALKNVKLKISFADKADETGSLADYICPDHHYLESWNDAEPKPGSYSLAQPTISPLFKHTRSAQDSLLAWAGIKSDFYTYLQNYWKSNVISGSFQEAWDKALHDGVYEGKGSARVINTTDLPLLPTIVSDTTSTQAAPVTSNVAVTANLASVAENISRNYKADSVGYEIKFYEKVGMGLGDMANNPWIQELPDPISKATWDNYLAIPKKLAKEKKLEQGDLVTLTVNGKKLDKAVPVVIQPGQANNTVSIAIGYGRTKAGLCGNDIGANVYPFVAFKDGSLKFDAINVTFEPTGDRTQIAQTQTHHTIMARPIIQDSTLKEYLVNPAAGRYIPLIHTPDGPKHPEEITLWSGEHSKPNHLWGMVIDLNSCIGCGACVVSCQVENNIPVVGKKEVINRREMHWLRIDRYYSSEAETPELKEKKYFIKDEESSYDDLEAAAENPQVTFQPMLCQHCNHAPCETVCPVAATTHSSEGLNQMTYNRCIGTRYCANNCPYKVRRFNWFKYFDNEKFPDNTAMNNALGKMVLNPDVTVRSRGVMEKCTFCVQRIQEGKLTAKKERRRPVDGEIKTACAAACPTEAILFGDLNDPETVVYNQIKVENKERAYHVLEEINTQPNISYLTKIRNI
ncbi:MAG TPA: TAT-variant-translocated molybdopterin oxidoreductase [Cytophagaceae bacterium]|jgi:molybdopterin-containing oxidoreductase family iron-sulfur binding subunit